MKRILDFRNQVDYFLRQLIRWRMPGEIRPHSNRFELFEELSGAEKTRALSLAENLTGRYSLHTFKRTTGIGNYQESLFYLHMLETTFNGINWNIPDPIEVIDIGPSHWFYVQALHAFCSRYRASTPRTVRLRGYEADAFRVYADLHSRIDHAQAQIGDLPGVEYIPRAFTPSPTAADLIVMFFPFVFTSDHQAWGLPLSAYHPRDLLQSAWNSLKPGGYLLMANQGEAEHKQQAAWFDDCRIPIAASLHMDDLLFKYDLDRFLLVGGPHE
jgi:SAM-dependent methyltransferase